MPPSKVVELFGDNLTTKEIDQIYESVGTTNESGMEDLVFDFGTSEEERYNHNRDTNSTVKVLHTVFTSLRKIGFLTSLDEEGNEVPRSKPLDDWYLDYVHQYLEEKDASRLLHDNCHDFSNYETSDEEYSVIGFEGDL